MTKSLNGGLAGRVLAIVMFIFLGVFIASSGCSSKDDDAPGCGDHCKRVSQKVLSGESCDCWWELGLLLEHDDGFGVPNGGNLQCTKNPSVSTCKWETKCARNFYCGTDTPGLLPTCTTPDGSAKLECCANTLLPVGTCLSTDGGADSATDTSSGSDTTVVDSTADSVADSTLDSTADSVADSMVDSVSDVTDATTDSTADSVADSIADSSDASTDSAMDSTADSVADSTADVVTDTGTDTGAADTASSDTSDSAPADSGSDAVADGTSDGSDAAESAADGSETGDGASDAADASEVACTIPTTGGWTWVWYPPSSISFSSVLAFNTWTSATICTMTTCGSSAYICTVATPPIAAGEEWLIRGASTSCAVTGYMWAFDQGDYSCGACLSAGRCGKNNGKTELYYNGTLKFQANPDGTVPVGGPLKWNGKAPAPPSEVTYNGVMPT